MKILNERSFNNTVMGSDIVTPLDGANAMNKGKRVKRKISDEKHIVYSPSEHYTIYSTSQLRLMLASATDSVRVNAIKSILKKRGKLK